MESKESGEPRCFFNSLTEKKAEDIVLVIGTEISADTAPGDDTPQSWRCFLLRVINVAERLEVLPPAYVWEFRDRVKTEMDLLPIARDIARAMSQHSENLILNSYEECFKQIAEILEHQMACTDIVEAILNLIERGAMIVTTNAYNLLEASCQLKGKTMHSIDIQDPSKVLLWAKGLMPFSVFHMHGIYTDSCRIGMSPPGYEEALQNSKLMEALQDLYFTKTFVFLGCEKIFCNRIFQTLFFRFSPKAPELEHYMLGCKNDNYSFFNQQQKLLRLGVKLTSYGGTFSDFKHYIMMMSSAVCNQRPSGVTDKEAAPLQSSIDFEKTASPSTSNTPAASSSVTSNTCEIDPRVTNSQALEVLSISTVGEGLAATISIPPKVLAMPHAQILLNVNRHGQDHYDIEMHAVKRPRLDYTSAPMLPSSSRNTQPAADIQHPCEVPGCIEGLLTGQQELLDNSRQSIDVLQSIHRTMQAQGVASNNYSEQTHSELRLMRDCMKVQATAICSSTEKTNSELRLLRDSMAELTTANISLMHATNGLVMVNSNIARELTECREEMQRGRQQLVECMQHQRQAIESMAMQLSVDTTLFTAPIPSSQNTSSHPITRRTCSLRRSPCSCDCKRKL